MRRLRKWIIRVLLIVILVPIVGVLTVECWYLPYFWINKEKVELDMTETDEITVRPAVSVASNYHSLL